MNLANLLVRSACIDPQAPAVAMGKRTLYDYRELARRAGALAASLRDGLGLQPGDRVALAMSNCPAYLEVLYGVWFAGLAAVPINCKLHGREMQFILADSGASVLFAGADIADALSPHVASLPSLRRVVIAGSAEYERLSAAPAMRPLARAADDLAWLFYTSGTTGRPKGVMLSQRNLMTMTLCYFSDVDVAAREDAILYAAPMSHGAGLYNFAHVLVAARHVIPESGSFDAQEIFGLAEHHRNVSMFAAPTMVKRLVEQAERGGVDASGIKTIVYGGGPMYVEDIERALAVLGQRFVQIYGQGESPMTITALARRHFTNRAHPRFRQRIASVGVAQSAVEVCVHDDAGRELPAGETGEVVVRGDTVMPGYWNNREATTETLRGGWLHTGDVGVFDGDGFLTLRDRSKDVIISGGSNIYPREVEEVLLMHPAVHEVSVVGRAHPQWGEEVVAFVVTEPGMQLATEELDALCLDHIARFKRPRQYLLLPALPKNNYGKVLKSELREMLTGRGPQ